MGPVVLAHLDWQRPQDNRTGLGVASIAAATAAAGVDTEVVTDFVNRSGFAAETWIDGVVDRLQAAGPHATLGVSAYVWSEPEMRQLMSAARRRTSATVVVGGPQASYLASGQLDATYPDAHAFVRGHGERAMVAIATGDVRPALGIHTAGQPDRCVRADVPLSDLPSPYLEGTIPITSCVRWETQRGCPFACSFCQHRESGRRLRHRFLGMERLRAEAEAFAAAGVRRISVLDPIFHADRRRAVELLQMLVDVGVEATVSLQCRFELLDDAFLDAASRLDVELEFGLQTAIEAESRAIGRRNRMDRVAGAIDALHARAIPFEVSLIYGLPLQTPDSFEASVAWCLERGVPRLCAWPLMLLRGTPMEIERARWGFVESNERIPIVVQSRTFSRQDHAEMTALATRLGNTRDLRGHD